MLTKLRLVFSITIFFICFCGLAQSQYWQGRASKSAIGTKTMDRLRVHNVKVFSLQETAFLKELNTGSNAKNQSKIVYFPDMNGELVPFLVKEKPVFSPELSAKFPKIKSYSGHGVGSNKERIRFSVSPKGVQSMIVHASNRGNTFMQKAGKGSNDYIVYNRDANALPDRNFICSTKAAIEKGTGGRTLKLVEDKVLRKFRIAVSATGEYTQYHGGTVADALAAINATITRVDEVFENDLGVTLEVIPNDDLVIYTSAVTDPYNGNLNTQVQNTLTRVIGEENYDVGHLFHMDNNNGNAGFVGSVCVDNKKGSAFSSATDPEGDIYDIDFVAHELGHQFGANHTWSFESEGTGVQVEPGSGSTIMGYAGIVAGNNVASHGDDYFQYYSILQVQDYLATISCGETIAIADNPPVISPLSNYVIPKSTAFVLEGSATDPDIGDVLTYVWEQIDNGIVTKSTFGPTNPTGANFRSLKPTVAPYRYFPKLSQVVQGNLTQTNPAINTAWETSSDVEREFNFALTVRDNASGGGQVASDLMKVEVKNSSGPFVVTSQATTETYSAGSVQTVQWDVANTDKAPINAQTVDIFMSADGGLTFPTLLAENVPNDGLHKVVLPGEATTQGRIMVKANNNIFFAVNATDFTIETSAIVLNFPNVAYEVCQPDDMVIPFNYETYSGFNEETTFSVSGVPSGLIASFSPTTATTDNTPVTLTFSNTAGAPTGSYPVTVLATSASITKEVVLDLNIYDTSFPEIQLVSPEDGHLDAGIAQALEWEASPVATAYDIEIATDASFLNIIESASVIFNSYAPLNLVQETTYYWRVRPKNSCGTGTYGTPFSFTTKAITCKEKEAKGLPMTISAIGTPTVISKVTFLEDLPVSDINVNLDVSHTYLEDLTISLTSPSGTTVVLISSSCGDSRNINATFDDDGSAFVCGINPGITGVVKPLGSLASFNGESVLGEWVLQIKDNAASDGGTLNDFSMDVCVEGMFRPDEDNDGVFDDGDDLCLGTPKGAEVDINGCAVYRYPTDNFSVAVQSESCRNNNDGEVKIAATQPMDYSVTTTGNGIDLTESFTDAYVLGSLSAGTYNLCIAGTDGVVNYEPYCFEVVVTEPDPLSVTSKMSPDGKQTTLTLEGSMLYNIELNGRHLETGNEEITLDLQKGVNSLKVYTNKSCQGVFEQQIFVSDRAIVHPNPTNDYVRVFLGTGLNGVETAIFSPSGEFIPSKSRIINENEIELNFTGFPSGTYFVTLRGDKVKETHKVIKR